MIHRILIVVSLLILLVFFTACEKNVNPKQDLQDKDQGVEHWDLVWNDEFESVVIDDQKWNKLLWRPGWVNNELQAYTDRDTNLFIRDGKLIIRGLIEPGFTGTDHAGADYNADFTSGRLNTAGLETWTYGRFDIRAKLPKGRGSWPAIWMLGASISTAGWPHCGEIDIMEHVGYDDGNIHASIHTTEYNHMIGTQRSGQVTVETATDSFHVYSLEWDSTYIRYLVNNDPYFFIYNDSNGNENKWPFDSPHYMILNLAIGGDWGGSQGIDNSAFPMEMEVDYVQVFKKSEQSKNINITLRVDMKHETISGTGVWVSGGSISSGHPGGLQMIPVSGTTIWKTHLILPPNSNYTFKFRNGHYPDTWNGGWETVPDECGVDSYNNRQFFVTERDTAFPVICFGKCTDCD